MHHHDVVYGCWIYWSLYSPPKKLNTSNTLVHHEKLGSSLDLSKVQNR
jgi:hypothetical protein